MIPITSLGGWRCGMVALVVCSVALLPPRVAAQPGGMPTSRADAVQSAAARSARLAVARADTAAAFAELVAARARPNPTLSLEYTKSAPTYHVLADIPLDLPGIRGTRISSAQAARRAAQFRFELARASLALDADTTYTGVLAASARSEISTRNALDTDSLRRMVISRRNAGDASDMDVELATVAAGQQANIAATDSVALLSALLDLQLVMGMPTDRVLVQPTDSLAIPSPATLGVNGTTLDVAAAEAAYESAQLAARRQRRSIFAQPSLTLGAEFHDPGGDQGLLPVIGVAFPFPIFDRNRGAIAQADAARALARAELELARLESQARIARTRRELAAAMAAVERDRVLVLSANRVAGMSLTAYREGAASLPNVLEAQRSAREVLAQYVADLARAWNATAALRVYTLTSTSPR